MTIEECLKILVSKIGVNTSDKTILESIDKQVSKGTAFTDRQYELVKSKLLLFSNEFKNLDIDIQSEVENGLLEQPLREIDRSKYIKIATHSEMIGNKAVYESYKDNWKWIEVRFPFSKKVIQTINSIDINHKSKFHEKGSHQHFFKLTEINVYKVIDALKNSNFEISQELLELYEEVVNIQNSRGLFVPSYKNKELKNVKQSCIDLITAQLGSIDELKILDRKRLYGLTEVECKVPETLAGKIAKRDQISFLAKPSMYSLDDVAEACLILDRFPILVLIDEGKELEQLSKVYNAFKNLVPCHKQSVLFRVENKDSDHVNANSYVHKHKLNNWVDSNTEIVYIKKNKLSKILFNADWQPLCTLSLSGDRPRKQVELFTGNTDLTIFYDEEFSILGYRNGTLQTYY